MIFCDSGPLLQQPVADFCDNGLCNSDPLRQRLGITERRRVCLEPFIQAMTNEEQRRNVMYSKPKDLDEAAKMAEVLKSTHETGARKKELI